MDKMKGLAKGGWHPAGDKQIHRDSWKSDLKGMATGKKKDPYGEQKNHTSTPLSSLRDPESFGAPPKHTAYYGANGQAINRVGIASSAGSAAAQGGPTGGWGGNAVETGYAAKKRQQEEEERRRYEEEQAQQKKESGPWRVDGTGLRTDNLPKPPLRRDTPDDGTGSPSLPPRQQIGGPIRTTSPSLPPRQPPRQATGRPPPVLPPRQNEYPDEYTPAPPPPYQEATQCPNPSQIDEGAASRLTQAGVSVPGFGIGSQATPESPVNRGPPQGQLSELQQRFARMKTVANEADASSGSVEGLVQAAAQKKPPPPPPKKTGLSAAANNANGDVPAPPVPMGSKPRP